MQPQSARTLSLASVGPLDNSAFLMRQPARSAYNLYAAFSRSGRSATALYTREALCASPVSVAQETQNVHSMSECCSETNAGKATLCHAGGDDSRVRSCELGGSDFQHVRHPQVGNLRHPIPLGATG